MMKNKIIYSILTLLTGFASFAQVSGTNTGILYITGSSDILYAASDFTNNSGSALTNNGQFYVRGNLSNGQSAMVVGTGTLYLNGSSAQSLNGTQSFKTYHLTTNNSAGITLNNNLSVSGTHTFSNGIITTSATPNYLIYEAGSSYTGDGDTRHVNGWVKKNGTTNFVFPVGNGAVERTIALNSLSASSEFNARYLANTPNSYNLQIPVWDVNENEYWEINKVTGGTGTLTVNWDYNKVYFPNWIVPDILVSGYNGSLWTDNGGAGTASGTAATTGTVTSSSISAFNLFALGSRSYIVPLKLVSFNAYRPGNFTQITWTTLNEQNADHFTVLRSNNNSDFYPVGRLAARNNAAMQNYLTYDNESINHTAYYKLQLVDKDGRENFSKTVSVSVNANNQLLLIANPVHDKITLAATGPLNGLFNYTITAINGQVIQQGKLAIQNTGSYQIPFNRNMIPGTYSLEVSNGTERFNYKLLVN